MRQQQQNQYVEKIKACADSSSKSHNYVIGIEAKDVCNSATGDIEGFASYASKTIMIEANGDPIVLATNSACCSILKRRIL